MNPRRSLIVALGFCVLAALSLLGYLLWSDYGQSIRTAEIRTRDYAAILETRLDATLRRADANLVDLVRGLPVAALSKQTVPVYARTLNAGLDSRMVNFPELAGLRIFDAAGDQLYSSDRAKTPLGNVVDRGYFRRLRDDPQAGLVFSEVNVSRTTGRPTLVASRAVRDDQRTFRGIVIASVELQYFQTLFQSLNLGAQDAVSVHRSDDFSLIVGWPMGDGKFNARLPPDHVARTTLSADNKTATVTPSAGDAVRIYSFHGLGRYPFFVSVSVARAEALSAWRARALAVGLSSLSLVGLLVGLLFRLRRTEASEARSVAALVHSEERFRALFDRASDGILILSPSGAIVAVNDSFARMHGYARQEMLALNLSDLDTPETARLAPARIERILAGEPVTFEVAHYHKDGHVFLLEVSSTLVVSNGEPLIQCFHRDITERNRQESLIREHNALLTRQKTELEEMLGRVKRLEGLIAICSHCKKIRAETDDWHQLERYITEHSDAVFSHGICPECLEVQIQELDRMTGTAPAAVRSTG